MREHRITIRSFVKAASLLPVCWFLLPFATWAQGTTTYHLHAALSSTPGQFQLQTAGPSTAITTFQSGPLVVPGEYQVVGFDTQAGVPNVYGYFPIGSSVSFSLWMHTNRSGSNTIYPKAKVYVNNPSGPLLCSASTSTALTATPQKFNLSCTTTANVTLQQSDRLYLWVGVTQSGNATATIRANLKIEGTLNGNYDSQVTVPATVLPSFSVSGLSQPSGPVGATITINGQSFGSTQGSSQVKFGNTVATLGAGGWTNTAISAIVPNLPAGTVNVLVIIGGIASKATPFTVTPVLSTLSVNQGLPGTAVTLTGSNFGATQGASTVTFAGVSGPVAASVTSGGWSNSSISVTVPNGAVTGNVVVAVNGAQSNGLLFTVPPPHIDHLSRTSGPAGIRIAIYGSNFGAATGVVNFPGGGIEEILSWSDTKIWVTVSCNAITGNITVTRADGGAPSNGVSFTVTSQ